jgi:hypothetical protein
MTGTREVSAEPGCQGRSGLISAAVARLEPAGGGFEIAAEIGLGLVPRRRCAKNAG